MMPSPKPWQFGGSIGHAFSKIASVSKALSSERARMTAIVVPSTQASAITCCVCGLGISSLITSSRGLVALPMVVKPGRDRNDPARVEGVAHA